MEDDVIANSNLDVTIYLVQKLTTEEDVGSTNNKNQQINSSDGMDLLHLVNMAYRWQRRRRS